MDIESFAPARDSLYLAALFLGAGSGCILHYLRRRISTRWKNRSLTVGFCLFSCAAAAVSAALIFSAGMIFLESALFLPLGIAAVLAALAFRFPRAAGFPLFLVCGAAVVLIAIAFMRVPAPDDSGGFRVSLGSGGLVSLTPFSGGETREPVSFPPSGDSALEFRAVSFSCVRPLPVIGGRERGLIASVQSGGAVLFTDPRLGNRLFSGGIFRSLMNRFTVREEVSGRLELAELIQGAGKTVLFDGAGLIIR